MSPKGSFDFIGRVRNWHWSLEHDENIRFRTSRILSPPLFLAYRVFIFLFFLAGFGYDLYYFSQQSHPFAVYLTFLTHWTYFTQIVYFTVSLYTCAQFYFNIYTNSPSKDLREVSQSSDLNRDLLPIEKVQWILQSIVAGVSINVSILFWTSLADSNSFVYVNIQIHMLNSICMLLDSFLSASPIYFAHFRFPLTFLVFYGIFSLLYWAAGTHHGNSDVVYPIINYGEDPGQAFLYISLSFLLTLLGLMVHRQICRIREFLYLKHIAPNEVYGYKPIPDL